MTDLFDWADKREPRSASAISGNVISMGHGRLSIPVDHQHLELLDVGDVLDRYQVPALMSIVILRAVIAASEVKQRAKNRKRAAGLLRHQAEKKRLKDAG